MSLTGPELMKERLSIEWQEKKKKKKSPRYPYKLSELINGELQRDLYHRSVSAVGRILAGTQKPLISHLTALEEYWRTRKFRII